MNRSALFQEIYAAIFNPSSLQGEQGERTNTEWQADAVLTILRRFYPHIEQVYAGHLQKIHTDFRSYKPADSLKRLSQLISNEGNLDRIDAVDLAQTLEELGDQAARELAHRDALLDTAIRVQGAVIQLLNSNDVFIGTHWVDDIKNDNRLGQPALFAHVWSFGADMEEIPAEKLLFVADLVRRFGPHAVQAWVCHVRGWAKPIKGELDLNGFAALQYLNSIAQLPQSDEEEMHEGEWPGSVEPGEESEAVEVIDDEESVDDKASED